MFLPCITVFQKYVGVFSEDIQDVSRSMDSTLSRGGKHFTLRRRSVCSQDMPRQRLLSGMEEGGRTHILDTFCLAVRPRFGYASLALAIRPLSTCPLGEWMNHWSHKRNYQWPILLLSFWQGFLKGGLSYAKIRAAGITSSGKVTPTTPQS